MKPRLIVCCVAFLGSCAAPPLTLYTLGTPSVSTGAAPLNTQVGAAPTGKGADAAPLGNRPIVIAVARVTIPDELDTEDIVVRDGSTLRRSRLGRWASRLSLGLTDRLTQRLAERRPDAVVTDRPLTDTPAYRILVNIARLDVTTAGVAVLEADWLVVPRDPAAPTVRDRGRFTATEPGDTDQDVATLVGNALDQLARAIAINGR
jgi:uncharacterized lipoprotein YmbA